MFKINIVPYTLKFKNPAGTSRGVYKEHKVWYLLFINVETPLHFGIGECAPLQDLSCDYNEGYEKQLFSFCKLTEEKQMVDIEILRDYPSILFGMETAMRHYEQQSWQLWESPFSKGNKGITINGLIWMGNYSEMMQRIKVAINKGFRCIKMKIGAIDFNSELELLRHIRTQYSKEELELRVDANGAFTTQEAIEKLNLLAELNIHSIEQPIKAGQLKDMSLLCSISPLAIALDEELIGINNYEDKRSLLEKIKPQYIILKPSLHGGISGCEEWISLAEELGVLWWATSALESNIGLNSIAQWTATFKNNLPQGLGTGSLYTNNISLPLNIEGEQLWFSPKGSFPNLSSFRTNE
ncbi:MAG TPA: o-succinylbenzoate synthase [Bacteroidales bacterium]|nr:o-succinylbenzoate synthase [Bacteroidales bacterium]